MTPQQPSRRRFLATLGVAAGAAVAGCGSTGDGASGETGGTEEREPAMTATETETDMAGQQGWESMALTDVLTDETFTVADLDADPVLLEFFAVWCPICTEQQREIGTLTGQRDDFVPVSLNVDPNENAETVREHAESKGFDWRYAVAPPAMTRQLVDEFGTVVTSPPSAPIVRRCPDGAASLIEGSRAKSAETLSSALDEC